MTVLEGVFLAVFWAWCFSAALFLRNTVLPRTPVTITPAFLELPSATVRFRATDVVPLEGWTIPAGLDAPWVILCHGVGANRADLLDAAAGLHRAGFNLLLFDFRGHGGSGGGQVTSFGYREQRDLEGALAFLGQQPEVAARPYGVYGISMGGAVALMVAAGDERIGAVAADSPYTNLEETLGHHQTLLYPVPKLPFLWFVLATYRLRFGVWPRRVSPEGSIARLSPRRLLLIHGGADRRMPVAGARRLFRRAGKPKELWVVEAAGHLGGLAADPEAYQARLARFFQAGLRP